jgi:hypothetical protein
VDGDGGRRAGFCLRKDTRALPASLQALIGVCLLKVEMMGFYFTFPSLLRPWLGLSTPISKPLRLEEEEE